jgi:hypothetical protein
MQRAVLSTSVVSKPRKGKTLICKRAGVHTHGRKGKKERENEVVIYITIITSLLLTVE